MKSSFSNHVSTVKVEFWNFTSFFTFSPIFLDDVLNGMIYNTRIVVLINYVGRFF